MTTRTTVSGEAVYDPVVWSGVNSCARLLLVGFFVRENSLSLFMESGFGFHFYYKGLCMEWMRKDFGGDLLYC